MTDQEKIKWLTTALRDLAMSADRYIDDGSYIDHLYNDIHEALNAVAFVDEVESPSGKLWYCQGYWNDSRKPMTCLICDGEWDGIEDAADEHITFYTEGEPVVGNHGEFTVTEAEPFAPDWWENKVAGVQIP